MAEYQVLRRAPISEALIDIRVKLSSKIDVRQIDSIYESIKPGYPQKLEQRISQRLMVTVIYPLTKNKLSRQD